jgi:non-heme chloroperoxidase
MGIQHRTPGMSVYATRGLTPLVAPDATWAQAEFRSGHFLTSDGVELHYLEAGSGPTLVFVPGWTMPAWIWEHQLRHFASTHRVVALDPRGQGRSEKPTYGYHASRRALDIRELLEHLGGEPAVVAGWSLAMQEVLVLAHQFGTEHLRAAVLVDHPINIDPEVSREIAKERLMSLQVEREKWTRGFVGEMYRSPRSEAYLEEITRAALSTPTNAAAIMMANLHFLGPTDLRPALASLDRPALFIYSSLDWAVEAGERVREGWPDIPVEIIDETSHALFVERPEQFNRVLEEFLNGLYHRQILFGATASARSELEPTSSFG